MVLLRVWSGVWKVDNCLPQRMATVPDVAAKEVG